MQECTCSIDSVVSLSAFIRYIVWIILHHKPLHPYLYTYWHTAIYYRVFDMHQNCAEKIQYGDDKQSSVLRWNLVTIEEQGQALTLFNSVHYYSSLINRAVVGCWLSSAARSTFLLKCAAPIVSSSPPPLLLRHRPHHARAPCQGWHGAEAMD